MEAVRRAGDGEICGHVVLLDGRWHARTVFGASLGEHDDRSAAIDHVLAEGLASLAERWTLHDGATGETETVCIVEVRPGRVTLALGHYSLPGVPTRVVTTEQLVAGEWRLERQQPSA